MQHYRQAYLDLVAWIPTLIYYKTVLSSWIETVKYTFSISIRKSLFSTINTDILLCLAPWLHDSDTVFLSAPWTGRPFVFLLVQLHGQ